MSCGGGSCYSLAAVILHKSRVYTRQHVARQHVAWCKRGLSLYIKIILSVDQGATAGWMNRCSWYINNTTTHRASRWISSCVCVILYPYCEVHAVCDNYIANDNRLTAYCSGSRKHRHEHDFRNVSEIYNVTSGTPCCPMQQGVNNNPPTPHTPCTPPPSAELLEQC